MRHTLTVLGLVTLALAVWMLLWYALFFVLLVFAGVLLAVFLAGLARPVDRVLPGPRSVAVLLVSLGLLAAVAGGLWYMGPALVEQFTGLLETVPRALESLREWVRTHSWGPAVLERVPSASQLGTRSQDVFGRITGFFSVTLGALTNLAIVLFLGVYLALSPGLYRRAILALAPRARQDRTGEVLDALGHALWRWLLGRLASMAVIAALTIAGLLILGVPLPWGLGVLAGLLSFVPFLGPIVSAVPAMLVAFVERPSLAFWVAGLFAIVQVVESYLVTPLIQKRAVSLPPAVLIAAQILFGMMAGILGVLLATPSTVVVVVLVQMLYLEDARGRNVEPLGA